MTKQPVILVVDDEKSIREIISRYLKKEGYHALTAVDGIEAFETIKSNKPDLIICDLMMPNMDGKALCRKVKESEDLKDILFIMLTAKSKVEDMIEGLELGADEYITKPFNNQEVMARVHAMLRIKELQDTIKEYSKKLEQKVAERTHQIFSLYEFAKELNSLITLDDTLELIVDFAMDCLKSQRASIVLYERNYVVTKDISDTATRGFVRRKIQQGSDIYTAFLQFKEATILNDLYSLPQLEWIAQTDLLYIVRTPSLFSPIKTKRGMKKVGFLIVSDKTDQFSYREEDQQTLTYIADAASIAISNHIFRMQLEESYIDIIKALAMAIEAKDSYTRGHVERVRTYCNQIGQRIGLLEEELKILDYAAILHDIGKIGIPEDIINKPDTLTSEEYSRIKEHPTLGEGMIEHIPSLAAVCKIIRHHHERFDGTGFPDGLKGEELEIGARILAIADAYDAMITERPYRKSLSKKQATKEIKSNAGSQFDPKCIKVFLEILGEEG